MHECQQMTPAEASFQGDFIWCEAGEFYFMNFL